MRILPVEDDDGEAEHGDVRLEHQMTIDVGDFIGVDLVQHVDLVRKLVEEDGGFEGSQ